MAGTCRIGSGRKSPENHDAKNAEKMLAFYRLRRERGKWARKQLNNFKAERKNSENVKP